MPEITTPYINPFTDYGFKRLFGEEPNKDLLIDFLNQVLEGETGKIESLTYLKTEHIGPTELDRGAVFDLFCENQRGEKFIVELQKAKQNYFKDRSVYYATFPIRDQAQKGDWDFKLKHVYTIGILDFTFSDDMKPAEDRVVSTVKLMDVETKCLFYDKLTFIYLEMPKFKKTEEELETGFDKWLYVLRHLARLNKRPEKLRERIFERLFQAAEIAAFNPKELHEYEESLKRYRDIKNVVDTARDEGREEGREEGRTEEKRAVAKNMKTAGLSIEIIVNVTGLNEKEIMGL